MKKDSSFPGFYFNSAAILFGASFIFFIAQSAYSLIELKAFTMDIGATLLNAVLSAIMSALVKAAGEYMKNTLQSENENKKLWNLPHPEHSAIFLSAHKGQIRPNHTGTANPCMVGEGQIQALPHIIKSLHQAYGNNYAWDNIYPACNSEAGAAHHDNKNLILIGGPLTNQLTKWLFSDVRNRVDVQLMTNDALHINIPKDDLPFLRKVERAKVKVNGEKPITTDYALILHVTLENSKTEHKAVVIAGCNTFSTGAAAHHFCNLLQKDKKWQDIDGKDYVAVVKCHVNAEHCDCARTELIFIHAI